jgi:hypothetical protein
MDIAVQTTVGVMDGVSVAAGITTTGATCATGVQALMSKMILSKTQVDRFMGIPPNDKPDYG